MKPILRPTRNQLAKLRREGRYLWLLEPLKRLLDARNTIAKRFFWDVLIIRKMRRLGIVEDLDELFYLASRGFYSAISPIQVRSEIIDALRIIKAERPNRIMEIGTAKGGTLFMLTRVARPDAQIISIDLPGGLFGGGYPLRFVPLFESMPLPNQTLHLLRADSHRPETLRRAKQILNDDLLDVLFIDGDHSRKGVEQDVAMYGPLVRKNGLVLFHDINPTSLSSGGDVPEFWREFRVGRDVTEFIESAGQGYGIGICRIN